REVRGHGVEQRAGEDQRRAGQQGHDRADEAREHQDGDDDVDERHRLGSRCTSGAGLGSVVATTRPTAARPSHGHAYEPVWSTTRPKTGGPTSTPLHANATATPVSSPA